MSKWISILEYSKKHKIPRSNIYFQIWTNRAKFNWKKQEVKKEVYKIKDE
jgi:hypothetical protein